jgi:hypothetical protein
LRDFDFNFFLAVFSATLLHSDSLFQILQWKSNDIVYCAEEIGNFRLILQQFREDSDSLWEGIVKMTPSSYSVKRNGMELMEGEDKKLTYQRMFTEITRISLMAWLSSLTFSVAIAGCNILHISHSTSDSLQLFVCLDTAA